MKRKSLFGGVALSLSFMMTIGALIGVAGHKAIEAKADVPPVACSYTEIVLDDSIEWNFRTLWLNHFGFEDGYAMSDFAAFVADYYENDLSTSWDKEGSTKGYKHYTDGGSTDGYNLCAGGTGLSHSFALPIWVSYVEVFVENNGNSLTANYINNLYEYTNNTGSTNLGSGVGKTINIAPGGNWGSHVTLGSAAYSTDFDTTINVVVKTDASTQIGTDSVQMSKYDHIDGYVKEGYTFDGWYTDAALETPLNGPVCSYTTLYAKMTENPHTYKVKFGSNAAISMTVQSPGDYYAQYKVDTAVTLGDSISFLVDDVAVSATADSLDTNNCYDGKIIESAANAAVWLKLTNNAGTITYSYWIDGRTHDYFFKDGVGSTGLVAMEPNPENVNEYYALGVVCQNNWTVQKYTDSVSNFYYDAASDGRWELGGSNNTIARSGGVFDVYYKVDINTCYFQYATSTAIKVRLDSGSYQTMTDDTAHIEDPTFNKQYKYTATVSGGEAVHFFAYDNSTNYELPASADTTALNNINTESGTIITGGTVDIYLKRKLSGGWEYYVSGREVNYYLQVNDSKYVPLTANPQASGQFMATNVDFVANDTIKLYATSSYNGTLNNDSKPENAWSTMTGGLIKCDLGGTYNVYYTPSNGNDLYFEPVSAADVEAEEYAQSFLNRMATVCKEYGKTVVKDLRTAWINSYIYYKGDPNIPVEGISDEAKGILHDASTIGEGVLHDFARKYDWIISHYIDELTLQGGNFVGRDITSYKSPTVFSPLGEDTTSNIVAIVTIISLISVTAIGAFFYIKKRKHI